MFFHQISFMVISTRQHIIIPTIYLSITPPTNSKIKYTLISSSKWLYNFNIYGWFKEYIIFTSFYIYSTIFVFLSIAFSTILIAYIIFVFLWVTFFTTPNAPIWNNIINCTLTKNFLLFKIFSLRFRFPTCLDCWRQKE